MGPLGTLSSETEMCLNQDGKAQDVGTCKAPG